VPFRSFFDRLLASTLVQNPSLGDTMNVVLWYNGDTLFGKLVTDNQGRIYTAAAEYDHASQMLKMYNVENDLLQVKVVALLDRTYRSQLLECNLPANDKKL
jgi:hypothetical protein